jgi:hypothetical protein
MSGGNLTDSRSLLNASFARNKTEEGRNSFLSQKRRFVHGVLDYARHGIWICQVLCSEQATFQK